MTTTPTPTPTPTPATTPAAAPTTADQNASLADQPVLIEKSYEPSPDQITADLRELDAVYLAQVPKAPEGYRMPDALQGLAPAEWQEWRTIAHAEQFGQAELDQFAYALKNAAQDHARGYSVEDAGFRARTEEQLRHDWGGDYERQLGYARAEAKILAKHPKLGELLGTTLAGSSVSMIKILAHRHERRLARK